MRASLTINDTEVLQDYHDILIPKAIEYSTGILDYFFRGQLEATLTCGTTPGMRGLEIKNVTGDKFLGGAFKLFWDDSEGDRTELTGASFTTTYNGALADNDIITAEFAPQANAEKYVLVYKGTIGADGSTAHDAVDQNIAIAVATIESDCAEWSLLAWGTPHLDDSGDAPYFSFSPENSCGDTAILSQSNPGPSRTIGGNNRATLTYNGPACASTINIEISNLSGDVESPTCGVRVRDLTANETLVDVEFRDFSSDEGPVQFFLIGNGQWSVPFELPNTSETDHQIQVEIWGAISVYDDAPPSAITMQVTFSKE
jgi:hypothetical protein